MSHPLYLSLSLAVSMSKNRVRRYTTNKQIIIIKGRGISFHSNVNVYKYLLYLQNVTRGTNTQWWMTTNDKMIIEGRSRVSKRKEVDIGLNIFYIINCAQKEKRTGSIDIHDNARVSFSKILSEFIAQHYKKSPFTAVTTTSSRIYWKDNT